jgi:polyisoprenoid-binding protein YceI
VRPIRPLLLVLALAAAAGPAGAAASAAPAWTVDLGRSLFAVLTRKAGPAARLAHDHLIVARAPRVELGFDPSAPETARLAVAIPVQSLDVDPPAERAARSARLRELGLLDAELPPVDEGDRAKVRAAMLDEGQLDGARFPAVSAELVALERRGGGAAARVALGWDATIRLTVRGKTVERRVPARWELVDGELRAEAVAEARFTEFGIEPYSAFLGAVRNADLFHFVVEIVARPAASPAAP